MRHRWSVLALAVAAAAAPPTLASQSLFSFAARTGYSGFTGADFDAAGAALILDLSLRYGQRHGFALAAGGHFSNHTVADSVELDVIGGYLEARYTFPTVSTNVLPFVTFRGGYARHAFTTGSGGGTQEATQDGYAIGGTLGVDYELSDRFDVEIAGLYNVVALDDASLNGNVVPGSERNGGQWAVLVGVVFRAGR
ncbi:MAG TPA: outer membrane beta-barrel protein [Gemmatimonadales bacterium]|nr:outer membrane beta-barrel protein [Gemmatimonadales bacterium]